MWKAGIINIVVGLLLTAVTGFSFVTKERIVEIGDVEITADKKHRVNWSPMAAIAVIVVGGIMIAAGGKEK